MIAQRTLAHRRRQTADSGAAAVEFALVALPLIVLAVGAFDYFSANYEITALEGAARGLGEYARDAPDCGSIGFGGGSMTSACSNSLSSLWGTMQSNNSFLSTAAFIPASDTQIYYTCVNNRKISTSPPTCDVNGDTRVIEYVQVTVTQPGWQLFPWDPWSSTNPLVARMSMRLQ
jgi:Flp pilus assembly protein TadG